MSSIFKYGVFNADPHPGNYLFSIQGKVIFLDFGCVKHFTDTIIQTWQGSVRAVLEDDLPAIKKYATQLGIVRNKHKFNWPAHLQVMNHIYKPFKHDESFTYTHEYVKESYNAFFKDNKNRFNATMPPDFLFVNRLTFGMDSVLADLNASANWHKIFISSVL